MADDRIELRIDDKEFMRALRDIIEMSSKEMPEVINRTAIDVCFQANKNTKRADKGSIDALKGTKLVHALATRAGAVKGQGNKRKANRIVSARKAAVGYGKAIWLKMASDLGKKLRARASIKHATGTKAEPGVKPTAKLAVDGLQGDLVNNIMQDALDRAVRAKAADMRKSVNDRLAKIAARKSGRR